MKSKGENGRRDQREVRSQITEGYVNHDKESIFYFIHNRKFYVLILTFRIRFFCL